MARVFCSHSDKGFSEGLFTTALVIKLQRALEMALWEAAISELFKGSIGKILNRVAEISSKCRSDSGKACPCAKKLENHLSKRSDDISFAELYKTFATSKNCKIREEGCDALESLRDVANIAAQEHIDGERE